MRFLLILVLFSSSFPVFANDAMAQYEEALTYFNKGRFSSAEIAVKNSLKENVNYLPARLLLGEILLQTGKYQAAEKEFEQAQKLHADSYAVIIPLVKVKLFLHKNQQALKLLSQNPQLEANRDYFILQGNAYKEEQQYEEALSSYQQALVMHKDSVELLTALADLWYRQEEIAKARVEITKALALQQDYIPALLLSIEIHKSLSEFEQATKQIEFILAKDKQNQQALFAKASLFLVRNQLTAALTIALTLRELFPEDPYAKLLHSSIVAQQGHDREARRLLADIKQQLSGIDDRHQSDKQVLLLAATVNFINSNIIKAKQKFLQYIELYGENANARRYLAIIAFRQENYNSAQFHIEKALINNASNSEIYILAAEIYNKSALEAKKLAILKTAWLKFPHNEKIQQYYISTLLADNKFDLAFDILSKNKSNSSLQNKVILAFMQLEQSLFEQAKLTTQSLLNKYPDKIEVLQLAGELSLKTGQKQRAKYFFEQALVLDEQFSPAILALAGMSLHQQDLDKTELYYQQLLNINQHDEIVLQLYADLAIKQKNLTLAIKLLKPLAQQSNYQAGRALLELYIESKQYAQAGELLSNLEKEYPLDEQLLLQKAQFNAQTNQNDIAKKTLSILFGLAYQNPTKLTVLAHRQLDLNDLSAAKKTLTRIAAIENVAVAPLLQARFYLMTDKYTAAGDIIEKQLVENKDDIAWLALKGHWLIAQKQFGKASIVFENLYSAQLSKTQLGSKNAQRKTMQLLAQLYVEMDKEEQLKLLLTQWLAATPDDAWCAAQLSSLLLTQGEKAKSIQIIENFPKLYQQPIFLNNLANFYLDKDIDKALDYAKKAYDLAPQIAAINDTLGWLYYNNKQPSKALGLLREAAARDTNNGEIFYHLALTLIALDHKQQAQTTLLKAIKLAPEAPLRKIASAKIL